MKNRGSLWKLLFGSSIFLILFAVTFTFFPEIYFELGIRIYNFTEYYALLSTLIALLLVSSIMVRFETVPSGTREVSVIGVLTALSAASRLVIPIPNVKPCTFLIIVTGYVFGQEAGIMVGVLTPAVSNMFLGQGPWTVWQMLMWAIAGWSGSLLRKYMPSMSIEFLCGYCFAWGFIFGMPLDFFTWLSYNGEAPLIPIMIAGIPFNLLDSFGNFLFAASAGKYTMSILERYRQRLTIRFND